jgi:hypothetical protein
LRLTPAIGCHKLPAIRNFDGLDFALKLAD